MNEDQADDLLSILQQMLKQMEAIEWSIRAPK
jgi:hypothetical protein